MKVELVGHAKLGAQIGDLQSIHLDSESFATGGEACAQFAPVQPSTRFAEHLQSGGLVQHQSRATLESDRNQTRLQVQPAAGSDGRARFPIGSV